MIKLSIAVALAAGLLVSTASAEPQTSRSFYDSRGHFSGSATTRGNSTSFTDSRGHFSGSAIRHRDGTSYYDRSGRFIGSSANTSR